MAFEPFAIYAPGTPQSVIQQWEGPHFGPKQVTSLSTGLSPINLNGTRWTNPTGGPSLNQGDEATITWSIVPDSTPVAGGATGTSNLIAYMDGIYGTAAGPVANRPWFPLFKKIYDNWSDLTGIDFVYEPADDGAPMGTPARGVTGVRGDVRISGAAIDGPSNVLAYNFFPNVGGNEGTDGDMVIDTTDDFYSIFSDGPTGENRGLINVLGHEAGHGIGLGHVIPVDSTKLMEPFVNFAFLGPQHDDIRAAQTLYGDRFSRNDSSATAVALGALSTTAINVSDVSIEGTDSDWYSFTAVSGDRLDLSVAPVGFNYIVGPQGGNTGFVDSARLSDLQFELYDPSGAQILVQNATGLGLSEDISKLILQSAGTYKLHVLGTATTEAQLYRVTLARTIPTLPTGTANQQPSLIGVAPNDGILLEMDIAEPRSKLTFAPTQLTLTFDGSNKLDVNTLDAISVVYSEKGDFTDGVNIPVGFRELDSAGRVVTLRFAEALKDGLYRIVVTTDLQNISGLPFLPNVVTSDHQNVEFDLELGGHVVAVVPQPVNSRTPTAITRRSADIDVYFDDIELFQAGSNLTTDVSVYQLINTSGTVQLGDDAFRNPITITPDVTNRKVTLTFASDLDQLFGAASAGSYRLRIGDNLNASSIPVTPVAVITDPGIGVGSAQNVNVVAGRWTRSITQTITNALTGTQLPLADNPGGATEIGHRDIESEDHFLSPGGTDTNNGITQLAYTFLKGQVYGTDIFGAPLTTRITPEQEERFREVMELYGSLLGIDVVETESGGLPLIVGDLIANGGVSGPGGVAGLGGPGRVVMDFADFGTASDNVFGGNFFGVALHEVGHAIGLGHTYEQPPGTIMGSTGAYPSSSTWAFPGDVDLVHGERLHQKESLDVDMYRFQVNEAGTFTAETFAERLASASLLDTRLTLYKADSSGKLTLVTANDDYFGSDSFVSYSLTAGDYYIGVAAEGNNAFDPNTNSLTAGGVSSGAYELRLDFKPTTVTSLKDSAGTALDGDRDGKAGGNYDFWFEVTPTSGVNPTLPTTIYVHKAAPSDYDTITPGIQLGDGSQARPFRDIDDAFAAAKPGDTVRIVADYGLDGNLNTPADALGFNIGRIASLNQTLQDGRNLEVPAGVNVVIDAGTILKFLDARMSVGSDENGVDRSGATLQVLGTPQNPVFFTSFNDRAVGRNFNAVAAAPGSGNWGGIELRNDADRDQGRADLERQGIFQNYLNHADIRYGGGQVTTLGRPINPIQLSSVRADISYNTIRDSADAAISADPDTFEVTTFAEPRYQRFGTFSTDYDRIGPDVFRNQLIDNTTNGLFVRVDTLAGNIQEKLEVSARFDDVDIVHVVGQTVQLLGTPGGPFGETVAPPSNTIGLTAVAGTSIPAGTYTYRYTQVDQYGNESVASAVSPTSVTVAAGPNRAISLSGLPAATGIFVSRRLYRSNGGAFQLVAELDRSTPSYVDRLAVPLAPQLNLSGVVIRGRPDASLIIDPGTIIKSQGARFELGFGATMIAEGTPGREVVFTARADDRYGAGGTFDTNDDGATAPTPGAWGGIYAGRVSRLSLDNAFIAFGGGITSLEGVTGGFNVIEIHQAQARIANSHFESNANGSGGSTGATREGRGPHDASVIFVEASQPIIVGNSFVDNTGAQSAAISINANAMNSFLLRDTGRQTGDITLYDAPPGNAGPLFRGNELDGNTLNGLRIRGEVLTTESVWDDTDIVHVVDSDITVPDFHTYGGLRLQSSASESLVVKSDSAEFLATGRPLDINDRIGGRIQVLGTPSFPVVMTSVNDCSIGAGFTPEGLPQNDTSNSGLCSAISAATAPFVDVIVVMDETVTMGGTQQFSTQFIQDLENGLLAAGIGNTRGANQYGLIGFGSNNFEDGRVIPLGADANPFGTVPEYIAAANSTLVTNGAVEDGYLAMDLLPLFPVRPEAAKFVILASDEDRDITDPTKTYASTLAYLQTAGFNFQGIVNLDIRNSTGLTTALALDAASTAYIQTGGTYTTSPNGQILFGFGTTETDYADLAFATGGIVGDITQIGASAQTANVFSQVLVASIVGQAGGANPALAGEWQGITFDQYSHDRNVESVVELEGAISGFGDANAEVGSDQNLGQLARNEKSSDENLRLGFTIYGSVADQGDVDVYSFTGTAGTLTWFDIDRTDPGLNTVLELIDANGKILAISDDSRRETTTGALTFVDASIPSGHALPMKMDTLASTNAIDGSYYDLYSLNDGDSGMRVVLPGVVGTQSTYYVRVRSFNSTSLTNLANLTSGNTKGGYQLQVRLRETDEVGGSTVRNADLRFASTAIQALGLPAHTPFTGELSFANNTLNLGNFSNTDRGAVSIAGNSAGPVDAYTFTVGRDGIQVINDPNQAPAAVAGDNKVSLTIDVDWSDNVTRPNTNAYLYWRPDANSNYQLVAIGTDSNIADDRSINGQTSTEQDLSRGSLGPKDAYIGPLEMTSIGNYQLFVANNAQVPAEMMQFMILNAPDPLARIEPLDIGARIADDRFTINGNEEPPAPQGPTPLQVAFNDDGSNILPWQFGDVPLLAMREFANDASRLSIYNPFTGRHDAIINIAGNTAGANIGLTNTFPIGSFAGSANGRVIAIERPNGGASDGNTDTVVSVDSDGNFVPVGTTGIGTFEFNPGAAAPGGQRGANDGMNFEALAFFESTNSTTRFLYGVANRPTFTPMGGARDANGNLANTGFAAAQTPSNIIYRIDPDTGAAVSRRGTNMPGGFESIDPLFAFNTDANGGNNLPPETPWAGTDVVAQVQIPTTSPTTFQPTGNVTSIVADLTAATLYAFTNLGAVWQIPIQVGATGVYGAGDLRAPTILIDPTVAVPAIIRDSLGNALIFDKVTQGPATFTDAANGTVDLRTKYFGVTAAGAMYAFDLTNRVADPIFAYGADRVVMDNTATGGTYAGLYFSPLDQNLWHLSNTATNQAGHGFTNLNAGARNATPGGGTLFFGFDPLNTDFNHLSNGVVANTVPASMPTGFTGYNFLGGAHGSIQSDEIDLSGISADDEPTLYFTYQLSTESRNADISPGTNNFMRDSLRVYVAGTDNVWRLVATNNVDNNANPLNNRDWDPGDGTNREFSATDSRYTNAGTQTFVQELFDDAANFRQARIDLGQWAGQNNVRIRYEFSTAGESNADQSEIQAADAYRIPDQLQFTVNGAMPNRLATTLGTAALPTLTKQFEFDAGLVVNLPSGAAIPDGAAITRPDTSVVVRFVKGAIGNPLTDVLITNADTAATVAQKVQALIPTTVLSVDRPSWINLTAETTAGNYLFNGSNALVLGTPGVAALSVAIPIDISMDAITVRDQIQLALSNEIHYANAAPTLESFPVVGNTSAVRVYNLRVAVTNVPTGTTNPLVLINGESSGTSNLTGSTFGVYRSRSLQDMVIAGQRSRGGGAGVHIDDVVIGLAERGEHISGQTPQNAALRDNPYFEPIFAGTPSQEIASGPYQVEIRSSLEYADPSTQSSTQLDKLGTLLPNSRLAEGLNLVVFSDGSQILDGQTFTVSNGYETVVFEFNDVTPGSGVTGLVVSGNIPIDYTSSSTAGQIASVIRNQLNSPAVSAKLNIIATSAGGLTTGVTTDPTIFIHGHAASNVLGDVNFGPHIGAVVNGQDLVLGEDDGDRNLHRDQGQLLISSNIIRDSSNVGILADAAPRAPGAKALAEGARPKPGSPQNFPTLNNTNQVPGVVITNNLIYGNAAGGIVLSGDTTAANQAQAASPFARVVNNTIFGVRANDVGIRIDTTASPTLLNNIVANTGTGIQVAASAGQVEVRATLFQNNVNNGTLGTESLIAQPTDTIFVDTNTGNFYPAPQSLAIDSSIDVQGDRLLLLNVKNVIGIAPSPILAPDRDLVGQVRADDNTVNTPAGVGVNLNKDRGAFDRVDQAGPLAQLLLPLDNDRNNLDGDPLNSNVFRDLSGQRPLSYMAIQLSEVNGIGPDGATVTRNSVILTENGRLLNEGVDYTFGYSSSSRQIRLTPLTRAWRQDAVYEVTLLNQDYSFTNLPAGNAISDRTQFTLTGTSTATYEFDSGYVLQLADPLSFTVPSGIAVGGFQIGDTFSVTLPGVTPVTSVFELTDLAGQVAVINAGRVPVIVASGQTATEVRDAILVALLAQPQLLLNPVAVGSDMIQLGANSGQTFSLGGTPLVLTGGTSTIADGQTFSYFDKGDYAGTDGVKVTFEIDVVNGPNPGLNPLPGNVPNTHTPIAILSTDTPDQIASKIAAALRAADLRLTTARQIEGGRVYVGGDAVDLLDVETLAATLTGTPGVTESYRLTIPATGEAGIPAGDPTFSITNNGTTTLFELSRDTASVGVRVLLTPGESALSVATKIAAAIRSVTALGLPNAQVNPNDSTQIILNEGFDAVVDVMNSGFLITGVSGGAIAIPYIPSTIFTEETVANQVIGAVTATSGLNVEAFTVGGGRVYFSGLNANTGFTAVGVQGIRDLAGNLLQSNRPSRLTRFTILLGNEKKFDFGDADSIQTVKSADGARHVILSGPEQTHRAWFGGAIVDGEVDGTRSAGATGDGADEDGLAPPTIFTVFNADYNRLHPAEVTVNIFSDLVNDPNNLTLASGLVDAWADWNQDGDFDDAGEQVLKNIPVLEGSNLLKIVTPAGALAGNTVLRLRVSQTGNLLPDEVVVGGEVEDHTIFVTAGSAPVIRNDTYTWIEDPNPSNLSPAPVVYTSASAVVPGTLVANDTDADNDSVSVLQITDPFTGRSFLVRPGIPAAITLQDQLNVGGARSVAGIITVNVDGSFTFQTDPDYNTDNYPSNPANPQGDRRLVFLYQAVDSSGVPSLFNGSADPATVTLNILPTNDPPVPGADGPIQVLEDFDGESISDNATISVRGLYGVATTVTATANVPLGTIPANAGPIVVNVTDGFLDPEVVNFGGFYDIDIDDNRISFNLRAGVGSFRGVLPVGYSEVYTFQFSGLPLTEVINSIVVDGAANSQPIVTIVNRNTISVQFAAGMNVADGLQAAINVTTIQAPVGTVPLTINGQSVNAIVRANSAVTATSSKLEMLIPASALLANDTTGGERDPVRVFQGSAANVFVDLTATATSPAVADVVPFANLGDYVAVGFSRAFDALYLDRTGGTRGIGGTVAWEYLSSTGTWQTLSVVDATAGFTSPLANNQKVSFTVPSDWNAQALNGQSQFWVRARTTATFTNLPDFGRVTLSPANFNEQVPLDDGIGGLDLDRQTLSLVSVQAFNAQPGYDVALTVNTLTFDFGNGPETAIRIVPEEHAVGFGQFTYVVQDDGGIDRANPPGNLINQSTGTVSIEFKRVNDAPIPDAFRHADRNYNVNEIADPNPNNPLTTPALIIQASDLLAFNSGNPFRFDEPGPRRGNLNAIEEFAEQQLRIMRILPTSQQGGIVVGIDSNPAIPGFEAIGYTPPANFDSFDDNTGLATVPDVISYFVSDYSLTGQSPESWIRDAAGNLVLSPRSLENELPAAQIQVLVNPDNDAPGISGNPDSSNSPSFGTLLPPVVAPQTVRDLNTAIVEAREDTSVTYPGFLGPQGTGTFNNPRGFIGADSGVNEHDPLFLNDPLQAVTFTGAGFTIATAQGGSLVVGTRSVTPDVRDGDYSVTYNPPTDFFGNDSVVLRLMDQPLNVLIPSKSTLITITFSVRPVNDTPLGATDNIHILEDTTGVIAPTLVLSNDLISTGNILEDQNIFGNVSQSNVQFTLDNTQVAGNFVSLRKVSGWGSVSGLAADDGDVGFDVNGNLTVKPPKGIYTKAKDINGNFVDVREPLIFTYKFFNPGTSFIDHDNNPATPLIVDPNDVTKLSGETTVTVHVWPVNDAPVVSTTHLYQPIEDTQLRIDAMDLVVDGISAAGPASTPSLTQIDEDDDLIPGAAVPRGNAVNIPAGAQDSAGEFENVGPDATFSVSDLTSFTGGIPVQIPTQQLRLMPFAGNQTTLQTTLGGSVTFDATANNGLGAFTYTPPTNFYSFTASDVDTFVYRVRDNGYTFAFAGNTTASLNPPIQPVASQELEAFGTITLLVNPSNDRPEVNPGTFEALEDVNRVITNVLAFSNARPGPTTGTLEIDGLTLTVTAQTQRGGTAVLGAKKPNGDYDLTYTSGANVYGEDVVTFSLTDVPPPNGGTPQTITYSVTVTVRPVNDVPLAVNDRIFMLEDDTALIAVSQLTVNDDVDTFGNNPVPGPANGRAALSEDTNIAGNPTQRVQDLQVPTVRLSPNNQVAGATVNVGSDGRIRVVPPLNYYSIVNGVSVGNPILIEYTLRDTGSSFFLLDQLTSQFASQSDRKEAVGTLTVDIYQVNDAPVGTTHTFNDVNEDTPRVILPSELLLVPSDVVNPGDLAPSSKDSAGPLENIGPDDRYNVAPFNENALTQNLRIVGLGASTSNLQTTIPTLRGGSVTLANGQLTYTPPLNFSSAINSFTDTFNYVIRDDGKSASLPVGVTSSLLPLAENSDEKLSIGTVTLNVNAVNDPPEFFIGSDLNLLEDETRNSKGYDPNSQEIVIPGFAVGIRGGPAGALDEVSQIVNFQLSVLSGDAGIFATNAGSPVLSLSPTGTLRVKLAPNASGQAVISVVGTDDFVGGPARTPPLAGSPITFTVTVGAVNDAPEFQILPAVTQNGNRIQVAPTGSLRDPLEDENTISVPVIVPGSLLPGPAAALPPVLPVSLGGGETGQDVTLFVELVNPAQSQLFSEVPRINTNGELVFKTANNAFTTNPILIRVYATDNGLSQSPNVNRSLPSPAIGGEVTLTLNVTPVNDPPLAVNDPATTNGYITNEKTALTISAPGILENDRDPDSLVLTVASINGSITLTGLSAQGATVTSLSTGQVTYDPRNVAAFRALAAGAQLVDTFTYTATDGLLESNTATATIVVTGVNDSPVAVADAFRVGKNRLTSMVLTTNDNDPDSRITAESVVVSQPQHGTLTVQPDGTVVYQPALDYIGIDQFTYTIEDAEGLRSQPAVVTLTVEAVPATVEDFVSLVKNRTVTIQPLSNDAAGLDPATLQILGNPSNGTIQVNPTTGEITYTPDTDYVGSDFIVYSVRQAGNNGLETDATRITVGVTGSAGQSAIQITDVNNSGLVSALDALLIINHLNNGTDVDVSSLETKGYFDPKEGPFVDVNGNGSVQPIDALLVINYLNQQASAQSEVAPPATSGSSSGTGASSGSSRVYPATPLRSSASTSSSIVVNAPPTANNDFESLLDELAEERRRRESDASAIDEFWSQIGGL